MKSKKWFLTACILLAAVIVMAAYCVHCAIARKPTITQHDFPFSITYEMNGKTETIEGVYAVSFVGNTGYVNPTVRAYRGEMISQRDDLATVCTIATDEDGEVALYTRLYADYLMGDPEYNYFSDEVYAPELVYYDWEGFEYPDEMLARKGIRIVDWDYPEPIRNSFVFSHMAHMSGEVVLPLLVMAAVAWLAVVIFVKKEKTAGKRWMHWLAVILDFVIALGLVPFATVYGVWSDIVGSSAELLHQLGYVMPAITVLGLAASVGLRRKGFKKSGFAAQLTGPAAFALLMICLIIKESL